MNSAVVGGGTSNVEVSGISPEGFWLTLSSERLFVAYAEFPWFRNATAGQIGRVQLFGHDHLHWPELDIDLAVESVRNPSAFPLVSRSGT